MKKKQQRKLSKTPRHPEHSRTVQFSISMREKISDNWIAIRKEAVANKPKKPRRRKKR